MLDYTTVDDKELAILLRDGDNLAYTEIYSRYHVSLYIHAYKKLKIREEAKDVVHELFCKLWSNRSSLVLTGSLSGYLYKAVRNRILDIIAHKQIESAYIVSLQDFIHSGHYITDFRLRESELSAVIEKEIACLPSKMGEVFVLSRKSHLSYREISEKLGISEQTVKKQVYNALKILKIKLGHVLFVIISLIF